MTKIITVHGTFAGDEADEGEKWWQRGSEFLTDLQDYIEEPLEIEPFHWSGNNSELDRRKAGQELWKNLKEEEEPPIIIGHSHGGSVGIHAAAIAVLKQGEKAGKLIRGFLSVGTPMILFKGNRNPFTVFNIVGRLLLLYALTMLAFIITGIFDWESRPFVERIPEILALAPSSSLGTRDFGFWISIGIILILLAYNSRARKRRKLFARNEVAKVFANKYVDLTHRQDEAINGLTEARTVRPKAFTLKNLSFGLFSILSFGILFMDPISDVGSYLSSDDHYYHEVEGIDRLRQPNVFHVDDPFSGYRFPDVGESRGWYDPVGAQRYRFRKDMWLVTFDELWAGPLATEALADIDNLWIFDLKDSLPTDSGVIFVELSKIEELLDNFDSVVSALGSLGREAYIQKVVCVYGFQDTCSGDEPVSVELEKLALSYHTLFTIISLGELESALLDVGEEPDSNYLLPSAIITTLPHAPFSALVEETLLPADSAIIAGKWSASYGGDVCQNETGTILICDILYAEKDSLWRELYRFGDRKFELQSLEEAILPDSILILTPFLNSIAPTYLFIIILLAATGIVGLIFGLVATPVLNATFISVLHKKAYGNDVYGENISNIRPGMNFSEAEVGTLPASVQEEMINQSMTDAPMAIQRLRKLMAGEGLGDGGVDPISVATKFEKSELIHNAYFHSPQFTRYVAAILVEKYGLTPSAKFKANQSAMTYRYTM